MLTVSDIIHLIQYYYHTSNFATAVTDVETLRLESLRGKPFLERSANMSDPLSSDIEKALGVNTPPLLWASPDQSLYEAAYLLIQTHARRLPLLDNDSETGHEMIVSIMTQYRLLKFISINVRFLHPFDQYKGTDVSCFTLVYERGCTTSPPPSQTGYRDICRRYQGRSRGCSTVLAVGNSNNVNPRFRRRPRILRTWYIRSTHY